MATGITTVITISNPKMLDKLNDKYRDTTPFLEVAAARGLSRMQLNLRDSYTRGGYRTGRLMQSLLPDRKRSIMRVSQGQMAVGTNVEYAAIQDKGGVILPKRGRALAIPATDKMKKAARWPRDFPRGALRFVPTPNNPKLVGFLEDATKGKSLGFGKRALFWLVAKVRIRPKNFARWLQTDIDKLVGKDWPKFLRGELV